MKKTALVTALMMLAVIGINPAHAYITNGDFETGNLSGWTTDDMNIIVENTTWAYSGNYAVEFTTKDKIGSLSQYIPTEVGKTYELSYYLRSAGGTNTFTTKVDGNVLLSLQNFGQDYVYYSQYFTASSALTEITFSSQQEYGAYLDDIDVVPAPEPITFLLVGGGLLGAGFMRRKIKS